ncbi:hypothetical protein D3Z48_19735 [Clostridiaceae bacterium]|nr:hypothetical protein [Clostridiaceae bacterium]
MAVLRDRYGHRPAPASLAGGSPSWSPKKRGISHGDVVDLNRENIRGFDVREFYVKLAADLKRRGY